MRDIIYVSEKKVNGKSAASKARNDVDETFERVIKNQAPCRNCIGVSGGSFSAQAGKFLDYCKFKSAMKKLKGKVIFIQQVPCRKRFKIDGIIEKAAEKNKIVYLIHDVDFIRDGTTGEQKDREIKLLNSASVLICHNPAMIAELKRNGVTKPQFVDLGVFDYLLPEVPENPHEFGRSVVYAGNLAKAPFLNELSGVKLGFNLVLYGVNYTAAENPEVTYMGARSPEALVGELTQSFGLIWDSETVDGCTGKAGEYTRYNDPHKLSLYLVAGMPVIVWSNAAIAKFVSENKVGFTIDSLSDISEKLNSLTKEEYAEYVKNAAVLKEKLSKGYFTEKAVKAAIEICGE